MIRTVLATTIYLRHFAEPPVPMTLLPRDARAMLITIYGSAFVRVRWAPIPPVQPQVTAKVWADSFDEPLSRAVSRDDTESKFLIGRETDLDNIGDRASIRGEGNLNLADATFNGVALGGDRADGVAYFNSGWNNKYSYAGILSGTNLGAPLTDTAGSAKWIGSFKANAGTRTAPVDFVLSVSFGTGEGVGEIEALVQHNSYSADYHIKGEFDDAGVITGTAGLGTFRTNDHNNTNLTYAKRKLTGLIGEEGAIGGFFIFGFGGFVARPPSAEELRTLSKPAPMTRLIVFALLDMNPSVMRLLNTVLSVTTPMMKGAILPRNGRIAFMTLLAVGVIGIFQSIMSKRRQTALRFVAQRGMRIIAFALSGILLTISARTTRLMRNALVIVVMTTTAGTPVQITLLPRDARAMCITICG